MLGCDATGLDEEASHPAFQHCIVAAKAHAQLPQNPLNELLLGEEALTARSRLFPDIAQKTHQGLAKATVR
jgi:hypothetical protein